MANALISRKKTLEREKLGCSASKPDACIRKLGCTHECTHAARLARANHFFNWHTPNLTDQVPQHRHRDLHGNRWTSARVDGWMVERCPLLGPLAMVAFRA